MLKKVSLVWYGGINSQLLYFFIRESTVSIAAQASTNGGRFGGINWKLGQRNVKSMWMSLRKERRNKIAERGEPCLTYEKSRKERISAVLIFNVAFSIAQ